jgi:hypothetical protein
MAEMYLTENKISVILPAELRLMIMIHLSQRRIGRTPIIRCIFHEKSSFAN